MNPRLQEKISNLPLLPGVYFFKDKQGNVIYIGKAVKLKNRVRQYFQSPKHKDLKTKALVSDIADLSFEVVGSELEALFLEAELVRRYLPKYNILLRDDKSVSYIRINYDSNHPVVKIVRRPLDDGARYFGPYLSTTEIRIALKYLRKIFPYSIQSSGSRKVSLDYFLGLDPGLEENKTSLKKYKSNLRKLIAVIEGKQQLIEKNIEKRMLRAATLQNFELAAKYRNQLSALKNLNNQVMVSSRLSNLEVKDDSLSQLKEILKLSEISHRIEGYDISHMQGTNVVSSMVVFTEGLSDKPAYRKFKMTTQQNDDFKNMNETILRRFSQKNISEWGIPNLVLIDGGKGQLDAAISARNLMNMERIPFIGLAKKTEQIVLQIKREDKKPGSGINIDQKLLSEINGTTEKSDSFILINLPLEAPALKLLQRIRDESHRFAVNYHTVLKRKYSVKSILDDIPGIGKSTRIKVLKNFKSIRRLNSVSVDEISAVIGLDKAQKIKNYLKNNNVI